MNEERTELWLRQTEHICGHLWHRYTVMVNQVMTTTVKFVMTSILPLGTLGSVATLLTATKYHGNHDSNHKLWNITSTERYVLHMQVLLECCYIKIKSSQLENWNHLLTFENKPSKQPLTGDRVPIPTSRVKSYRCLLNIRFVSPVSSSYYVSQFSVTYTSTDNYSVLYLQIYRL